MVHPLEHHELVNGGDGRGIVRRDAQLRTTGQIANVVRDRRAFLGHHCGPRNLAQMHEVRSPEVARGERARDVAQMPANLCDA